MTPQSYDKFLELEEFLQLVRESRGLEAVITQLQADPKLNPAANRFLQNLQKPWPQQRPIINKQALENELYDELLLNFRRLAKANNLERKPSTSQALVSSTSNMPHPIPGVNGDGAPTNYVNNVAVQPQDPDQQLMDYLAKPENAPVLKLALALRLANRPQGPQPGDGGGKQLKEELAQEYRSRPLPRPSPF